MTKLKMVYSGTKKTVFLFQIKLTFSSHNFLHGVNCCNFIFSHISSKISYKFSDFTSTSKRSVCVFAIGKCGMFV